MPNYPQKPVFQWRIREYINGLDREMVKRTYRAATLVQTTAQRNVRTPFRTAGPSKPGEYPHARTGLLLKSIQIKVEPEALRGWVYSNLSYALFLEHGTRTLLDRSFLRRTLWEVREQVKAIYLAPLPDGLAGGGKLVLGRKAA